MFNFLKKGKLPLNETVTKLSKARSAYEGSNIHGLQTVVLNKFDGYFDEPVYKQVRGSNVKQKVAKFKRTVIVKEKHNLLTDNGRDWMHAQVYTNTSAGTIGSNYLALSENASGASAAHTAVASEISTNGLSRAQATTLTHTTGTNTTTLAKTFTASGAFTAVQLAGLFNASSGVTLSHENTFTSTALASSDLLTVTWTLTLG